jgi:hypothetical protein
MGIYIYVTSCYTIILAHSLLVRSVHEQNTLLLSSSPRSFYERHICDALGVYFLAENIVDTAILAPRAKQCFMPKKRTFYRVKVTHYLEVIN